MKEEDIQQVRKEYAKIKKEKETLLSYKEELAKLMEKKSVKRFLELSSLVDRDYIGPSEEEIVRRTYENVSSATFGEKTINSNQIMVYIGSYIINNFDSNDAVLTYESDPNTSYKSYMDLETTEVYHIDKEECLDFEREYLVLYLPISEYSETEYYQKYCELQNWFKVQLLHHPQSNVIEEIQKKYSRGKYMSLYPSFHKIDTITDLPIDEYIEKHPEDGFVENCCLSKEEYMRVKLYRRQMNRNST